MTYSVSHTYTRASILTLLLLLCLYYLFGSSEHVPVDPYVRKDLECERKYEREPANYSADDHPNMQFFRKYGHVDALPTEDEVNNLSDKQVLYMYHSYLDNMDHLCHRKLRMGKAGDGGWEVCDDYEYRPIYPCTVYSFGIKNDFSFDDDVSKLYRCKVYAFDPSMNTSTHQRSKRVFFYNVGLGGSEGQLPPNAEAVAARNRWKVQSFGAIRKTLKHEQTPIDIVKMDIEHSEWLALEDMAETGQLLDIRQLLLEVHNAGGNMGVIRRKLTILAKLERQGFRRFFSHMNTGCGLQRRAYPSIRANCYEIYFVNTNFPHKMVV